MGINLEMNNTLFDLYCHYHKHTTKVIGYPIKCEICVKEKIKHLFGRDKK